MRASYAREIVFDRGQLSITQAQLVIKMREVHARYADPSKQLKVTQQAVSKWEQGALPNPYQMSILIKTLGENSKTAVKWRKRFEWRE